MISKVREARCLNHLPESAYGAKPQEMVLRHSLFSISNRLIVCLPYETDMIGIALANEIISGTYISLYLVCHFRDVFRMSVGLEVTVY